MDLLSVACEKSTLCKLFCNVNKWVQHWHFSLFTFTFSQYKQKPAITLYPRDLKSNLKEYRKSGAEIEVDQIVWEKCGYTEKVNYNTSSQNKSWNTLETPDRLYITVRETLRIFPLCQSLWWCCQTHLAVVDGFIIVRPHIISLESPRPNDAD